VFAFIAVTNNPRLAITLPNLKKKLFKAVTSFQNSKIAFGNLNLTQKLGLSRKRAKLMYFFGKTKKSCNKK
jgi:hypothetical protein